MKIQDILLFDDQLTDEELIIQKSARDYCQKELLPRITDANRNEIFGLVDYILSRKSSYLTGQNIILDGGYTSN